MTTRPRGYGHGRRHGRRRDPLDLDLAGALRSVRLAFGDEQVTVLSLVPRSEAEAERVEGDLACLVDRVADQILPYVQACIDLDREEADRAADQREEGQP
jgi:hypothetical protein